MPAVKTIQELRDTFPRPGAVEWLGLRPARRAPVQAVTVVEAHPLVGLIGDHGKLAPPRLTALTGEAGEAGRPANAPAVPGGPGRRQVTAARRRLPSRDRRPAGPPASRAAG